MKKTSGKTKKSRKKREFKQEFVLQTLKFATHIVEFIAAFITIPWH